MSESAILFAGGGTGGHIYPNVAVAERLRALQPDAGVCFLVSDRPGDARILGRLGYELATSVVQPLPPLTRPWRALSFFVAWRRALAHATELLRRRNIAAVVATGGFVSGPAVVAASRLGIPCALVNLDAIPGKANRRLIRYAPTIFSVYETADLPGATIVGLPLRSASVDRGPVTDARVALGLDPELPVLFVTGATHGAESVIRALMALVGSAEHSGMFAGWQVFHQCGTFDVATLQAAYDAAGVRAVVVAYCERMGTAWRAASLAVSRAGAGSVAEAWGNATPAIFLPNPYHHDQHQRHNAQPMVATGGALIIEDRIDPAANLASLGRECSRLMTDPAALEAMRQALQASLPPDGATTLAEWARAKLG